MATVKRPRTTSSKTKAAKAAVTEITAPPAKPPEVARVTTQAVDIYETVRTRAYELYAQRGYSHGQHLDDWFRAEAEVLARFGARSA